MSATCSHCYPYTSTSSTSPSPIAPRFQPWQSRVSKVLTIGTVALAPPFVSLGLVLLVIWALTAKGGYFWPMWPYSAMLLIT